MAKKTTKKRATAPRRSKVQTTKRTKKVAEPKAEARAPQADAKKLSLLAAAAQVLREAGRPMNCKEMIDACASQGLWDSPGGKTPAATLSSSILREIAKRGSEARFVKQVERGKFAAP